MPSQLRHYPLRELADRLNAVLSGPEDAVITGVAGVENAESGDLVFAESPRFLEAALRSRASAILVLPEMSTALQRPSKALLAVEKPRTAFVAVLEMFAPALNAPEGIHPTAQIGEETQIGAGARIGANVTLGNSVVLGDGVTLFPGVTIGDGCVIGAGSTLHPNVVLYSGVKIGSACILHAGCVIGADGFGYVPIGYALKKVPHLGSVEIGDEVEIGANSCVDRAKTGVTRIGSGTKIDNLVHIAHNVRVGQSCLIIAQAGVAGSVTIGNGVVLAGQAGIKDHVALGDGARVGAQGGVIGNVGAGVTVSGYPARPHQEKMREHAALSALPDTMKRIRAMEKRLAELEKHLQGAQAGAPPGHRSGDPGVPILPEEADREGYEGAVGPVGDVGPVG